MSKSDDGQEQLVWTVQDVAKQLRLSASHVYRLVHRNEIPHFKIGRCVRFSPVVIRERVLKKSER